MAGEPSQPDRIGIALSGIGAGATAGAGLGTIGLLVLRTWQSRSPGQLPPDTGFLLLTAGALAGVAGAALIAWLLARRIDDAWRRGVTAALAVFAAVLLSVPAMVADLVGGRAALAAYAVALLALAFYLGARARGAERGGPHASPAAERSAE